MLVIVAAALAEPKPEADPALVYAGYYGYHYPYVYYGLGKSAPCVNAANQPVPCAAYNGYAKRSAESEADPAYYAVPTVYGGYPYGYGVYGVGLVHTSHFGVCLNYKGEQVSC